MKVRSLSESVDRYVRHSIRAYCEGEQNLNWITGVIAHSGLPLIAAYGIFSQVPFTGNMERRSALLHWFGQHLQTTART
jgi:hypothetical protein